MARTDQWLRSALPGVDPLLVGTELGRRHLRCYRASQVEQFASGAGISTRQAHAIWKVIEAELEAIEFGERTCWLLTRDVEDLDVPLPSVSVRFLPPLDVWVPHGTVRRSSLIQPGIEESGAWQGSPVCCC